MSDNRPSIRFNKRPSEAFFPVSLCCRISPSCPIFLAHTSPPPPSSSSSPAPTHTPLTTTLSGWIFLFHVASCLSAPNYHFLRSCCPPPFPMFPACSPQWVLIPKPARALQASHTMTLMPVFFSSFNPWGVGGSKKLAGESNICSVWQLQRNSARCLWLLQLIIPNGSCRGTSKSLSLTNTCCLQDTPTQPAHHTKVSTDSQAWGDSCSLTLSHTHTKSPTSAWGSPQPPAQTSLSSRAVTQPHSVTKSHTVLKGVSCLITGYIFLFFLFAKSTGFTSKKCAGCERSLPSAWI